MASDEAPRCPVCQARFRDSRTCSRCGADLAPMMILIAKAHQLRQHAREALQRGKLELALWLATEAQAACSTPQGRDLRLLCAWLVVSKSAHPTVVRDSH
jgi:hypothetical protein